MTPPKNINDYLHLYLGAQCKVMGEDDCIWILKGVMESESEPGKIIALCDVPTEGEPACYVENYAQDVFPLLRKLEDVTNEETLAFYNINTPVIDLKDQFAYTKINAESTVYLLKQGFDLFGLIEAGLAIDKNSLK